MPRCAHLIFNIRLHRSGMTTFDEYVKDLLMNVRASYDNLHKLKDKPGDLVMINREWAKISGLLESLADRIASSGKQSDTHNSILAMSRDYLENYYFAREIETMSDLYADDPNRLKNIRLKIISSLEDKSFIDRIDNVISEL